MAPPQWFTPCETHTHTHTEKHTHTSRSLVRNNFWTLDKFAVAGSLYLPVIAFLCPLSALPSKLHRASGSWRRPGEKSTAHVVGLTRRAATSWQFIGHSVPYMDTSCAAHRSCQTDTLHHLLFAWKPVQLEQNIFNRSVCVCVCVSVCVQTRYTMA